MATISRYNLIHDLLNLLQKHQSSLQLQIKIMENSSSESQHKTSKSQKASFETMLGKELSDYVQENRRNSSSIITDLEGNAWNVRCNDLVVEEIREEERELEGKKFDFDEICFEDDDHDEQQQEVRSLGSSVSDGQESSLLNSSSCLSEDKKVDLEEGDMKNGHFGANLGDFDHSLIASPSFCEERMDLVEEKKSGDHFGASLGDSEPCLIASPGFCDVKFEEKMVEEKKNGHFDANLGEKNCCDEKMKKKMDLVDEEKKKKSEHFDANLEKRRSGRCRVSKWFAIVTIGVVLGMFILMSFDFANFGKKEGYLVPT